MLAGCDWWISIRHVDNTYDWRKFWKRFRECFVFQSRVSTKTVVTHHIQGRDALFDKSLPRRHFAATSHLLCTSLRQDACSVHASEFGRGEIWTSQRTSEYSERQDCFLYKTRLLLYLFLSFILKGEETSDCSGCLFFSTCSVAILNDFLKDHGKIIDVA